MRQVWEALRKEPSILVCDFDKTLTTSGSSMHMISKILGPESEFSKEREKLYKKYKELLSIHEPKIQDQKDAKTWWKKQMELYMQYKIPKELFYQASFMLPPREECVKLLLQCLKYQIPVWIVSAGIANVIDAWLETQQLKGNIFHVLANRIFYDHETPIGYSPVITMWNKEERFLQAVGDTFKNMKFVLFGDRLEDVNWKLDNSKSFLLDRQA